jgi:hypothetical protein
LPLSLGVLPNSPIQSTNVSCSSPRPWRSSERAAIMRWQAGAASTAPRAAPRPGAQPLPVASRPRSTRRPGRSSTSPATRSSGPGRLRYGPQRQCRRPRSSTYSSPASTTNSLF